MHKHKKCIKKQGLLDHLKNFFCLEKNNGLLQFFTLLLKFTNTVKLGRNEHDAMGPEKCVLYNWNSL